MAPVPPAAIDFWEQDGKLYEYPPELCIRNTFIESRAPRSPSLEEFITERRVRSCPSSGLDWTCKDEDDAEDEEDAVPSDTGQSEVFCLGYGDAHSRQRSSTSISTAAGSGTFAGPSTAASSSDGLGRREEDLEDVCADVESDTPDATQASPPTVLSLGALISDDPQNSDGFDGDGEAGWGEESVLMPTGGFVMASSKGAALHGTGMCKPCAFYHIKGCESGADCEFCHSCGPCEKKLRRKVRQEARRFQNVAAIRSKVQTMQAHAAMMGGMVLFPAVATTSFYL